MKNLTKILVAIYMAIMMIAVACKKDEPTPTTPTTPPTTTPPAVTKSTAKDLTKFSFAALSPVVDATIDASTKAITATVPATTDLTKLVPSITISDKSTISPVTGVAQDFSKEVSYTVTAEDGSTVVYKVNVMVTVNTTSLGTWVQKKGFPNDSISAGKSIAMVFGDKVIVGFGANDVFSKSIWEYNSLTDTWLRKANFPGEARIGVSSFVINGKGYVIGGGTAFLAKSFNELWEYDPTTDKWTKKTSYPETTGFVYGVAGVIDNKAYVGTGFKPYSLSWYEYDPSTDKWTKKANLPDSRGFCTSFVINKKMYVGTGTNSAKNSQKDFYEYDPSLNTWKQITDLAGGTRDFAFGFSLNGKGYLCGGAYFFKAGSVDDVYEYDPITNKWTQKSPMKTSIRAYGFSFVLNNKAYIGLGLNSSDNYSKDVWTVDF